MSDLDLEEGRVYPPLANILQVSIKMATQVGGFAYRENMALVYPEPMDKEEYIRYLSTPDRLCSREKGRSLPLCTLLCLLLIQSILSLNDIFWSCVPSKISVLV